MPYEEESIVAEWMDRLKDLNVSTKKMFGCYCLYCDGQAVGWIHDSVLSLREVGLTFLPMEIKRPGLEENLEAEKALIREWYFPERAQVKEKHYEGR